MGDVLSADTLGSGVIHDTYLLSSDNHGRVHRYVLQRINTDVFPDPDVLIANAIRVLEHIAQKTQGLEEGSEYRSLTFVQAQDGNYSWKDRTGDHWRAYEYIADSRTFDKVETATQAYEAAAAFGNFQALLQDLPTSELTEVIKDFHNTPARFAQLEYAIAQDAYDRVCQCAPEVSKARRYRDIADELLCLHASGQIPERVVHNDTKINNVLFDQQSAKAICVIDLDTVMPGLALFDFGDLVRTATIPVNEDEQDLSKVRMRIDIFESLVAGYLSTAGEFLNATEIDNLALCGRTITVENAIRFLTDYLEGDHYFKVERPGQNLDRCRTQFALAASIDKQLDRMQDIVDAAKNRTVPPG